MNLVNTILESLAIDEKTEEYAVLHYFLSENIKPLFSKVEFEREEIEIVRTLTCFHITTEEEKVLLFIDQINPFSMELIGTKKSPFGYDPVFTLTFHKEMIQNCISIPNGGREEYTIDREKNCFQYTMFQGEKWFYGSLIPLCLMKEHNRQVFSFRKESDTLKKQSFFSRLFLSEKWIELPISVLNESYLPYIDLIFTTLKQEASFHDEKRYVYKEK